MNSIFKLSLPNRYSELTDYIDKSAVKELEILYPKLIAEIFNTNTSINWGLRSLKADNNSYYAVLNFLLPNGPIFRLCYKLFLDCNLRYEFPYQYLPEVVRKRLEDNNDTSFYKQKLLTRSRTLTGNCIYLNAFEYYIFHFAYHLINPALVLPEENNLEWDTIYLRLVEAYLDHFVPCTTHLVYPLLNNSTSSVTTAQHSVGSFSPTNKTSSSIFREDVLKKMSPTPPSYAKTKIVSSTEIWRSELVATLFLDFWLSSYNEQPLKNLVPFASKKFWSIDYLPSKEQLRCVRLLLRHLHYFINHPLPEDCAMNDLKREIIPNNRRTIYTFFRNVMTQLPLDSSYRLLLETWFTYIQPWRYTNPYSKNIKLKQSKETIEKRWFSFIAENLIVYSSLYYIVLTRLSRCDLSTYKISSMSFRLMNVFSQLLLLEYIVEVENYLEEGKLGSINSWNSTIRQNIYAVEKLDFHYDGFFSQKHTQQVIEFIKQIKESIPTLQVRKKQILADQNVGFIKWFKEQLSGDLRYSSISEIEKIEFFLSTCLEKLYFVHKITTSDSASNISFFNYTNGNISESFNSCISCDSTNGSLSSSSFSTLKSDPREKRKQALSFKYEGDPDLYPIRSCESKFLVRVLYYFSLWINSQFCRDLKRLYYEDSITGGIVRQILCPPQQTHSFEKRCSPDGYSQRVSTFLPPRISFRWFANYYFTFFVFILYMVVKLCFKFSFFYFSFLILALYLLYLFINSIFYPLPIPEFKNDRSN